MLYYFEQLLHYNSRPGPVFGRRGAQGALQRVAAYLVDYNGPGL